MAFFFLFICICCSDHESSLADLKNKPRSFIKRLPQYLHPSMLFKLSMASTVSNTSMDLETINPNKYKSLTVPAELCILFAFMKFHTCLVLADALPAVQKI